MAATTLRLMLLYLVPSCSLGMPLFSYLSFSGIGDSGLVACDRIGMGYKGGLRAGKGGGWDCAGQILLDFR